ncbi:hypothetical protein [Actinoplanes siamensis]|uniref:CcmD family protein n=1 Tax=Actinoplanes siamensis TaxID=1223317 RepID=A0A919ND32_9ACTN|nr:hypothetical protein [Actinoplanes siamensis]GIF09004.1 hypothetical protein Asi03nite_65420 [Actinoplanes siamensis]
MRPPPASRPTPARCCAATPIGEPDTVRYACYLAIAAIWLAAFAYTVHQYRLHRDEDRLVVAEAATRAA